MSKGRITLKCTECGYETSVLEAELGMMRECPICGEQNSMQYVSPEKSDIEKSIEIMKENISISGHFYVWEMIESYTKAKIRLKYRDIFFKAEGIMPASSPIIRIDADDKWYVTTKEMSNGNR